MPIQIIEIKNVSYGSHVTIFNRNRMLIDYANSLGEVLGVEVEK